MALFGGKRFLALEKMAWNSHKICQKQRFFPRRCANQMHRPLGQYGGTYFSRGALYALLQNPAYIGKISHKGEIHEGLHDAIIPRELWDAVQEKLKEQAGCTKGALRTRNRNLLTGRLFDERGNPYSPVFTNKPEGKRYRYYVNQSLAENKAHPDYLRARFPAHEIERTIENAVRRHVPDLIVGQNGAAFAYFQKHHTSLPIHDLINALEVKVTVHHDKLTLALKLEGLAELAEEHLKIALMCRTGEMKITVPYQTERACHGAIIIKPEGKRNLFDLPAKNLKKLVRGVVWRDEHFDGMAIKAIARREGCSQDYVGSAIFYSFRTLQNAA